MMDHLNFFQADYRNHPAFSQLAFWDRRNDDEINQLIDTINSMLLAAEGELVLKKIDLAQAIAFLEPAFRKLLDFILNAGGPEHFKEFIGSMYREIIRVAIDDLAYFERRNSYQPVIQNEEELFLRNALALDGYYLFQLQDDEIEALQKSVAPFVAKLRANYAAGLKQREDLSTHHIDADSMQLVYSFFEKRGLNKAVSDVRHEVAQAGGFAVELSVADSDWWHSRYSDAGLGNNQAAYFHNDESRDVYKAIIYLGEVGLDTGPYSFIPASYLAEQGRLEWIFARAVLTAVNGPACKNVLTDMDPVKGLFSSPLARGWFAALPDRLRQNSHFGFDVTDTDPLSARLEENETILIGKAGTCIAFDGSRLVHRGGLVRQGERLGLQVVFHVDKANGLEYFRQLTQENAQ